MFPWLWFWAPQFHFPWSGSVAQRIEPRTWFDEHILPGAGHPVIEKQAFDVASYGKQLGLLTDVLFGLVQQAPPALDSKAGKALDELKKIDAVIQQFKEAEYSAEALRVTDVVRAARKRGGPSFDALARSLAQVLNEPAR